MMKRVHIQCITLPKQVIEAEQFDLVKTLLVMQRMANHALKVDGYQNFTFGFPLVIEEVEDSKIEARFTVTIEDLHNK